ncbi:MAG: hypothetical protein AAFP77_17325 [Bacteroidota bacterium]
MDYNTIKALLNKYFEGESSLAEEQQLREYFQGEHIAEDLRQYQPLFGYFQKAKQQVTSEAFDQRMSRPISRPKRSLRLVYRWAAAAAVVLMLGAGWFFNQQVEDPGPTASAIDWSKYEPATEEEAIELARGAFIKTSNAMYKGLNTAAQEVENVKKIMDWE